MMMLNSMKNTACSFTPIIPKDNQLLDAIAFAYGTVMFALTNCENNYIVLVEEKVVAPWDRSSSPKTSATAISDDS